MQQTSLFIHWNADPEIFRIGSFALRYYSLFFLTAFVSSYFILKNIFIKEGKDDLLLQKLSIYIFVGTLIGARIGHCLFYEFGYYKSHLLEIVLPFSWNNGQFKITGFQGLASHGGAVGILTAALLFCRKYKVNILWLLDRLMIAVAISAFFIRLGNFFNSEIIGRESNLPWAVVFEKVDMIPRHPTQLYEAGCYLLIFIMLLYLYKKRVAFTRPGFLFGFLLTSLFSVRIVIEFFKENQEVFEDTMVLNMGQLLSIPMILVGIYFIIRKNKKYEG